MAKWFVDRLQHIRELLRGIWLMIAALYGLIGFITLVRDNLLPEKTRAAWDTTKVLPHWSVSEWLVGALVIVLVGIIEASFRLTRRLRVDLDAAQNSGPLNVHVAPITAILDTENKNHTESVLSGGYLLTLHDFSITNQTAQAMSLDCTVRLRLLKPSFLHSEAWVGCKPLLLERRRAPFHFGVLALPPRETRTINMAFLLGEIDTLSAYGLENIADDGHDLTIQDRVSGRGRMVLFGIGTSHRRKNDGEP